MAVLRPATVIRLVSRTRNRAREDGSLYHDGMVWIIAAPTRATLIDFETTLPSAVEALLRQREERRRA